MDKPRIDELLPFAGGSRYALVMIAAKPARQINSYYRSLGEGGAFEDVAPPLVTTSSRNYLTISMEEVARGEIGFQIRGEQ